MNSLKRKSVEGFKNISLCVLYKVVFSKHLHSWLVTVVISYLFLLTFTFCFHQYVVGSHMFLSA